MRLGRRKHMAIKKYPPYYQTNVKTVSERLCRKLHVLQNKNPCGCCPKN